VPWVTRGLRNGVLTTRYPARPDGYPPSWRGRLVVKEIPAGGRPAAAEICPTGAIISTPGRPPSVDRGRCILCGRCVAERPDVFAFDPSFEVAGVVRPELVVPVAEETVGSIDAVRSELHRRVGALRRSVHIRHVDAGSDGCEEWEINALFGPVYDIQRLGLFLTASPRHADLLLVTGAGSAGMTGPLRSAYAAMPDPRVVVAVGTDAISGGLVSPSYATAGGVSRTVPVDVWVPGSPPSPFSILHGILLAVGRLPGGSPA
jgi:Ni,Fe-hydrogenase III small subunit/ferredoxin